MQGCDPYELMLEEAGGVVPGCEGLLFLPYLTGERTPHPDPLARGAFVGLTLRHGRAAMTRAVVEGVSFALRDSLELMRELQLPIAAVRAAGGGARSPLWSGLLADIFEASVVTSDQDAGSALGAALIAGVGCGLFPDFAASASALRGAERRREPDPQRATVLRGAYQRYRALYPALRESFVAASQD
jgi:xylulokinase